MEHEMYSKARTRDYTVHAKAYMAIINHGVYMPYLLM